MRAEDSPKSIDTKKTHKTKMRYDLTCSQCYRRYVAPIPLPAMDSWTVVMCNHCEIVLARFDWGNTTYDESQLGVSQEAEEH